MLPLPGDTFRATVEVDALVRFANVGLVSERVGVVGLV